jgi:hypothetical protein
VVVVGGGQAGLAIGYYLTRKGPDFTILEAADEPAAAWRERWDARRFELPVELGSHVRSMPQGRRRLHGRARRPRLRGRPGGDRHRPLPGAAHPKRILGRDLFWYLEATGLIRKTTASRIGRRMSGRDTLIGSTPRALRRRHGVELHGRAVEASGSTVTFSDGSTLDVGSVIWATGFELDHSWIDVPVFDDDGRPVHRRDVTDSPGLYFLGLTWQHTRGSALLGWVGDDAEHIAQRISSWSLTGSDVPAPSSQSTGV